MGYALHRQALLSIVLGLALLVNYLVAALVASLIPLTLHWLRSEPFIKRISSIPAPFTAK